MRVGEKETSEHAAIVERYADLFTREQYDGLAARTGEGTATSALFRLREACAAASIVARAGRAPTTTCRTSSSRRASSSAARSMPLRTAQAQVALESTTTPRARSSASSAATCSAEFNDARLDLMRRGGRRSRRS